MGIKGLLPAISAVRAGTHLSAFKGKTIAVDGHVWLHNACISCADKIAFNIPTTKFMNYCITRLNLLLSNGVTPYVVFDGRPFPLKKHTNALRKQNRISSLEQGKKLWHSKIESDKKKAYAFLCAGIDVKPHIVNEFVKYLKLHNVGYLIAPYEADAQLAYLEQKGICDAVLTVDSDLLVFGANKVIYNLDKKGNCSVILREQAITTLLGHSTYSDSAHEDFVKVCVMAGCDYLPNVRGIGIKRALSFFQAGGRSIQGAIREMMRAGHNVPLDYERLAAQACMAFAHQRVFCPLTRKLVLKSTSKEPESLLDEEVIGYNMEAKVLEEHCSGNLLMKSAAQSLPTPPSSQEEVKNVKQDYVETPSITTGIAAAVAAATISASLAVKRSRSSEDVSEVKRKPRISKYFIHANDPVAPLAAIEISIECEAQPTTFIESTEQPNAQNEGLLTHSSPQQKSSQSIFATEPERKQFKRTKCEIPDDTTDDDSDMIVRTITHGTEHESDSKSRRSTVAQGLESSFRKPFVSKYFLPKD